MIEISERGKLSMIQDNTTKTHNGDSNSYCLSPEETEKYMQATDECKMIVVGQKDLTKACIADVMAAEIEPANKIKDGIRPEQQGDSVNPQYAAEFGETVVIVTDQSKQQAGVAERKEENETQAASRRKLEIEQSAEEKYAKNNGNDR